MSLLEADRPYRDALAALAPALEASFSNAANADPTWFKSTGVTEAILARVGAFYDAQLAIKRHLGKRYIGAGADFLISTELPPDVAQDGRFTMAHVTDNRRQPLTIINQVSDFIEGSFYRGRDVKQLWVGTY